MHKGRLYFLVSLFALCLCAVITGGDSPLARQSKTAVTPNRYEVTIQKNVPVPMRDGIRLSSDIYLPAVEKTFPVVLARIPYGKSAPGIIPTIAKGLARQGAVFVLQDCRGRHNSEGVFTPFKDEVNDAADTLSWIKKQSWSNGDVAMIGFSYLGYTAWAAVAANQGRADAIVSITTCMTPYRMIYNRGALHYMLALDWSMMVDGKHNNPTQGFDWFRPVYAPLEKVDDTVNNDLLQYKNVVLRNVRDSYWKRHDLAPKISTMRAPALFLGGWYDIYTAQTLDDFVEYKKKSKVSGRKSGLIMGPWTHGLRRQEGDVDFGPTAGIATIAQALVAWLDVNLLHKDRMNSPPPQVMIFVMGENKWRNEAEWPLMRTRYQKFYLHSEGRAASTKDNGVLTMIPPGQEPEDEFTFDPKHPVPTVGGGLYPPQFAGPRDQRAVEHRNDVLVYTSDPLPEPMEITGPITMTLYASSSAKDTDFTAKLVAVQPDGRAMILQDGIVRARFRKSFYPPSYLTPGKVEQYSIDLAATSYLFSKGERIRVEVSSSNFPRFDVNRNTGAAPAKDDRYVIAKQKVYHDEKRPSYITLPVIPR